MFSAHYFLQYCNILRTIIKQTSMHRFCCGCLVTNFVFVCNKMGYPGPFFPKHRFHISWTLFPENIRKCPYGANCRKYLAK